MKTLITIDGTYVAKNNRQRLIQSFMEHLDGTLCPNATMAKKLIEKAYNMANNQYHGTAAQPKLTTWPNTNDSTGFMVEDTITITVYKVKNDLCV